MGVFEIIGWALFGLIIGLIARFLYPGRQPMGIVMTMILGIIGSLVGGAIGTSLFGREFEAGGWIMSIVGAILVVFLTTAIMGASRSGDRVR